MRFPRVAAATGVLIALGALVVARPAEASLTPSEEAQLKGYVAGADVTNAARVRAIVARPDLTVDEVASALSDAVTPVAWSEARALFFHELLFGGASASARPSLTVAIVRALVARADTIYAKLADVEARPDAAAEVAHLYAFLERDVAAAGHPHGDAHDPSSGIPASAYDAAASVLSDHVQRNPRWLKADAPLGPLAARLRAELEIAIYEMTNDTPTRRVDAADRIGLTGARRAFLTELGLLFLDSGKADDARVAKARAVVQRLPSSHVDVEALAFGEPSAGLSSRLPSRGQILGISLPLEATQVAAGYAMKSEEVTVGPLDLPLFVLAYELSLASLPRVFDNRGDLRALVDHDARLGARAGRAMTPEQTLAGVMAQLLIDAPRAVDLAFGRWLRGQPESAALLSDAMGALAAFAPPGTAAHGLVLPLARPKANGDLEPALATRVQLFPSGAASGFTLAGHRMDLVRDSEGTVVLVRADGTRVSLAALPTARVPLTDGSAWSGEGIVFARLLGSPRASVGLGRRVRLVSDGADPVDAIATPAPADDCAVDADLTIDGQGGVMLRAATLRGGYQGVSLVIDVATSREGKASLRLRTGPNAEASLGPAADLPVGPTYRVHVAVRGDSVDATVAGAKLSAKLPPSLVHGDVALRVGPGASLEANSLRVRP